jgi:transposase
VILDQGGEPVIPPRRHRKHQHRYDRIAYRLRWGIDGFFAKLKQWRRIATRYDKLAAEISGRSLRYETFAVLMCVLALNK